MAISAMCYGKYLSDRGHTPKSCKRGPRNLSYLHVCEFYGGRFVRPLLSVSDSGGSMSLQFQNNHCAAEQIRSTQVSTPNVELFSERS